MDKTNESNPPKLYHLACFEEMAGILHSVAGNEGIIVAYVGKIRLALPLDMGESIRPLVGKRISILKTNIPNKTYLFRILSEGVADETR